jgi:hypothetical protein
VQLKQSFYFSSWEAYLQVWSMLKKLDLPFIYSPEDQYIEFDSEHELYADDPSILVDIKLIFWKDAQ